MTALDEQVRNILMAEDDDDDFELFAEALNELSIRIFLTRAENGDVLMKILNENVPDMLFLDIIMPYRNGKDCLREIRENKRFDNLPIIVFSGVKDFDTVEFCFRKGTNLYVYKPRTYAELVDVIQKIFTINWKKVKYYPMRSEYVLNPEEGTRR